MYYKKIRDIIIIHQLSDMRQAELMVFIKLKKINVSLSQLRRVLINLIKFGILKTEKKRYGQKRKPTKFYSINN